MNELECDGLSRLGPAGVPPRAWSWIVQVLLSLSGVDEAAGAAGSAAGTVGAASGASGAEGDAAAAGTAAAAAAAVAGAGSSEGTGGIDRDSTFSGAVFVLRLSSVFCSQAL